MMDALREIIIGAAAYAAPLFCGRACIPVGCILWPIGFVLVILGIFDFLGEMSA